MNFNLWKVIDDKFLLALPYFMKLLSIFNLLNLAHKIFTSFLKEDLMILIFWMISIRAFLIW